MAKRKVLHLVRILAVHGGFSTSAICGNPGTTADGMNLTSNTNEVTCRNCLRMMYRHIDRALLASPFMPKHNV